jgi:hypothetical protein
MIHRNLSSNGIVNRVSYHTVVIAFLFQFYEEKHAKVMDTNDFEVGTAEVFKQVSILIKYRNSTQFVILKSD